MSCCSRCGCRVCRCCRGPSGPSGPSGPRGFSGPSGAQGLSGPSGAQGFSGPSGARGFSGFSGASGPSGATGPTSPVAFKFSGLVPTTGTAGIADAGVSTAPATLGVVPNYPWAGSPITLASMFVGIEQELVSGEFQIQLFHGAVPVATVTFTAPQPAGAALPAAPFALPLGTGDFFSLQATVTSGPISATAISATVST